MTPISAIGPLFPAFLERFRWTGLGKLPPTWAILAAAAVVVLLYILKLRRRQVEVPFSPLWARLLRDKEPTSFWRHLKRLFSMLLQFVVLALLLGAVADPRDRTELKTGRHLLVLLDTSASMQAMDGPPEPGEEAKGPRSRIAVAKEEIRKLIKKKRRNDLMMLVRMDGQVTPVTSWTKDAAVLEKALGEIAAAETSADIGRGLRFAADTLREAKEPILVLVGDGHYDEDQLRCVFWGAAPPKGFDCEAEGAAPDPSAPAPPRPEAMAPGAMAPEAMAPGAMAPPGPPARGDMTPEPPARLQAPRPEVLAAERFIDPIAMGKSAAHAIR
ncbi:MAG: VWA domain-containing protein, partial [Polyangia bacterium]|nr:VWA domain-containing protein [Polyangia bacterium]